MKTSMTDTTISSRGFWIDATEWWSYRLLQQTSLASFQVLDDILPNITPIEKSAATVMRLRVLSLWHDILSYVHLDGDFGLLCDRLLVMTTEFDFRKNDHCKDCHRILMLHEQLHDLYHGLVVKPSTMNDNNDSYKATIRQYKSELNSLFQDLPTPPELLEVVEVDETQNFLMNICTIQDRIEDIVHGEGILSYPRVKSTLQDLLLQWVDDYFDEPPKLFQLGYSLPDAAPDDVVTTTQQSQETVPRSATSPDSNSRKKEKRNASGPPESNKRKRTTHDDVDTSPLRTNLAENRRQPKEKSPVTAEPSRQKSSKTDDSSDSPWASFSEDSDDSDLVDSNSTLSRFAPNNRKTGDLASRILAQRKKEESRAVMSSALAKRTNPGRSTRRTVSDETSEIQERSRTGAFQGGKRRWYTKEEDDAIVEGVNILGWGKWTKLKKAYPSELYTRTGSQIKDRARVLKKEGRIN